METLQCLPNQINQCSKQHQYAKLWDKEPKRTS